MKERKHINSNAPWEKTVGYSRAIRAGNFIEVSGTCAVDESGAPFAPDDAYLQTKRILDIIKSAVEALGGSMKDVIRTRMYVTNIKDWEAIGRAHGETFQGINPVTTMVEVSGLIAKEFLVEIEVTAVIDS